MAHILPCSTLPNTGFHNANIFRWYHKGTPRAESHLLRRLQWRADTYRAVFSSLCCVFHILDYQAFARRPWLCRRSAHQCGIGILAHALQSITVTLPLVADEAALIMRTPEEMITDKDNAQMVVIRSTPSRPSARFRNAHHPTVAHCNLRKVRYDFDQSSDDPSGRHRNIMTFRHEECSPQPSANLGLSRSQHQFNRSSVHTAAVLNNSSECNIRSLEQLLGIYSMPGKSNSITLSTYSSTKFSHATDFLVILFSLRFGLPYLTMAAHPLHKIDQTHPLPTLHRRDFGVDGASIF